ALRPGQAGPRQPGNERRLMLPTEISAADALAHLSSPDRDAHALDRRRFLQLVGMGAGAGLLAGPSTSLLDVFLPGLDPAVWSLGPVGPNDGILVVIGMYGGNDGLNTVVPFADPTYYDQRRFDASPAPVDLAIDAEDTLTLDAGSGLNPR